METRDQGRGSVTEEGSQDNIVEGLRQRRKKRKWRFHIGPVKIYVDDEFEEIGNDDSKSKPTQSRRRFLLLKSVPLGLVVWVTDVISIAVHLGS